MELKSFIRDIPNFPEPGVLFRDITPLLRSPRAFGYVIDQLMGRYEGQTIDTIVAVESRGFLFGAPLGYRMGKPIVPVRKPGKLPADTHTTEYSLEYGSSTMEIHVDGLDNGERVLLLDDLLMEAERRGSETRIYLLEDCTSSVVVRDPQDPDKMLADFSDQFEQAKSRWRSQGVEMVSSRVLMSEWPGLR